LKSLWLGSCARSSDTGLQPLAALTGLHALGMNKFSAITARDLAPLRRLRILVMDVFGSLSVPVLQSLGSNIAPTLASATQLRILVLRQWVFELPIVSAVASLVSLRVLALCFPRNMKVDIQPLSALTKLEMLSLRSFQLAEASVKTLGCLTALQKLDLSGCSLLTDHNLWALAPLTNLQSLNLCGCERLTKPQALVSLTRLTRLYLRQCSITDVGLKLLTNLTELKYVALNRTKVTRHGSQVLAHCHLEWGDAPWEDDLGALATVTPPDWFVEE